MATPPAIIEYAGLADADLSKLRRIWSEHFGRAPTLRSPELLGLMLAYRLQAARYGGLESDLRRTIRRPSAGPGPVGLTPGTKLTREWQGVRHEVVVSSDRLYVHNGTSYRSLSQVARQITGSRWNGPRFFGLRADGEAK